MNAPVIRGGRLQAALGRLKPAPTYSGAALCVLLAACGSPTPEETESVTVVPVTVTAAQTATIVATVHATGLVAPAPGAEQLVVPPEPARIAEIPKAEGESVRRGDLLVRFEIPSSGAEAAKQQAEVGRAEARLQNGKAAQVRARDLFERGVAARKEIEDANREVADAEADLAGAHAALTAATTVASRATVRAAFDGVIARRSHNAGDLVDPGAAEPVIRVIDPRRVEVTASVPVTDVARVAIGRTARLLGAAGEGVTLTVASRPAAVTPGTAAVPIRLTFSHPTLLPVGTPVEVDIDAEQHADALVVPTEALVREADETAVYVKVDDAAQRRMVTIGLEDGQHVEILSGLKAGELVITRGQNGLPDGAKVTTGK